MGRQEAHGPKGQAQGPPMGRAGHAHMGMPMGLSMSNRHRKRLERRVLGGLYRLG